MFLGFYLAGPVENGQREVVHIGGVTSEQACEYAERRHNGSEIWWAFVSGKPGKYKINFEKFECDKGTR